MLALSPFRQTRILCGGNRSLSASISRSLPCFSVAGTFPMPLKFEDGYVEIHTSIIIKAYVYACSQVAVCLCIRWLSTLPFSYCIYTLGQNMQRVSTNQTRIPPLTSDVVCFDRRRIWEWLLIHCRLFLGGLVSASSISVSKAMILFMRYISRLKGIK